jgi:hypothetical protein
MGSDVLSGYAAALRARVPGAGHAVAPTAP